MQLVEQGKIGLDDPVADYIPAFADMQVLKAEAESLDGRGACFTNPCASVTS